MKRTKSLFVAIVAALMAFAIGCQPAAEEYDVPVDEGPRTEGVVFPSADDDSRAIVEQSEQSQAVAEEVGRSIVHTGGTVVKLADPLARALQGDSVASADGPLKQRIEAALAALVAATECLSVDWNLLRATVYFDQCVIPTTTETIDGSMTVAVRPLKLEVFVRTDGLTVAGHTFYGQFTGFLKGPLTSPTVGVDMDMTHANSETTLIVTDGRVTGNLQAVTVDGTGAVLSSLVDAAATAHAVTWNLDECAPSSGTVDYTQGPLTGTITFLETTPSTGEVLLDLPFLPPYAYPLFPPCPAEG